MDYSYEGKAPAICFYPATSKITISAGLTAMYNEAISFYMSPAPRFEHTFLYMQFEIPLDGDGVGERRKGWGTESWNKRKP